MDASAVPAVIPRYYIATPTAICVRYVAVIRATIAEQPIARVYEVLTGALMIAPTELEFCAQLRSSMPALMLTRIIGVLAAAAAAATSCSNDSC